MTTTRVPDPYVMRFDSDGRVPNHPRYPVLLYRSVLAGAGDHFDAFETLFEQHRWPVA